MHNLLTNLVCQVNCGSQNGTAFIISQYLAITVFHVVKECDTEEIVLKQYGIEVCKATLHDSINDTYKKLDFALLVLNEEIKRDKYLDLGFYDNIQAGTKWISRGYPKAKLIDGENIIEHDDNVVNQHLEHLRNGRIDIQLNHDKKWSSYEGLSGSPLVISNNVIGIINSELCEDSNSKELNALSLKYVQELLIQNEIHTLQHFNSKVDSKGVDVSGAKEYKKLTQYDLRNLPDKLSSVCENINSKKISLYCREQSSGKSEMSLHDDQEISAIKFRVFEVCQRELFDFVQKRNVSTLTVDEIDQLIDNYAKKAEEIISDKSKDYRYSLRSNNFMRKIVLDLINDCFLSFDEEGIYE